MTSIARQTRALSQVIARTLCSSTRQFAGQQPTFKYQPLFAAATEKTIPYKKLTGDHVKIHSVNGREYVKLVFQLFQALRTIILA